MIGCPLSVNLRNSKFYSVIKSFLLPKGNDHFTPALTCCDEETSLPPLRSNDLVNITHGYVIMYASFLRVNASFNRFRGVAPRKLQ